MGPLGRRPERPLRASASLLLHGGARRRRRVLDLGSGEGFGSALLARDGHGRARGRARRRRGRHARRNYGAANLEYRQGVDPRARRPARRLPRPRRLLEVIEHVSEHEELLALVHRAPGAGRPVRRLHRGIARSTGMSRGTRAPTTCEAGDAASSSICSSGTSPTTCSGARRRSSARELRPLDDAPSPAWSSGSRWPRTATARTRPTPPDRNLLAVASGRRCRRFPGCSLLSHAGRPRSLPAPPLAGAGVRAVGSPSVSTVRSRSSRPRSSRSSRPTEHARHAAARGRERQSRRRSRRGSKRSRGRAPGAP